MTRRSAFSIGIILVLGLAIASDAEGRGDGRFPERAGGVVPGGGGSFLTNDGGTQILTNDGGTQRLTPG